QDAHRLTTAGPARRPRATGSPPVTHGSVRSGSRSGSAGAAPSPACRPARGPAAGGGVVRSAHSASGETGSVGAGRADGSVRDGPDAAPLPSPPTVHPPATSAASSAAAATAARVLIGPPRARPAPRPAVP